MQAPSLQFGEYHAIAFSLDHYDAMAILFQSAFGIKLSRENFLHRYDTASLGSPVLGYIAIHGPSQQPAAYYGVFPLLIEWKGQTTLSAQSGDTMTHASHRKKGLFIWLARLTYEACKERNIFLVFGLPNQNSYPGFIQKLGWKEIGKINCYDLKLSVKTVPLGRWLGSRNKDWYLKWCRFLLGRKLISTPNEFDNPLPSDNARVKRNQHFMQYKAAPDKFFLQLGNCQLWIKCSDVLWVGEVSDYHLLDENKLAWLKRIAFFMGYNTIRFHLNEELGKPGFLKFFQKYEQEPSCYVDLDGNHDDFRILLTAADFDTW